MAGVGKAVGAASGTTSLGGVEIEIGWRSRPLDCSSSVPIPMFPGHTRLGDMASTHDLLAAPEIMTSGTSLGI